MTAKEAVCQIMDLEIRERALKALKQQGREDVKITPKNWNISSLFAFIKTDESYLWYELSLLMQSNRDVLNDTNLFDKLKDRHIHNVKDRERIYKSKESFDFC